jgi:hypothetical protein
MPRLVVSKAWVLVHEDGTEERLDTPRQFEKACQLFQDEPDRYQLDQRDLVELIP